MGLLSLLITLINGDFEVAAIENITSGDIIVAANNPH